MTFSSTGSWCGNPCPICKKSFPHQLPIRCLKYKARIVVRSNLLFYCHRFTKYTCGMSPKITPNTSGTEAKVQTTLQSNTCIQLNIHMTKLCPVCTTCGEQPIWRFIITLSVKMWITQQFKYKLKRCSNKECCKQCRYVKFKGTMTKWPVQKLTHRTTQKHAQHHDATGI